MRIGLCLGAGGARGLAHIVLLEVFDELGIRPVALTGCSIGGVVGAAYAAGLSGREIRAHTLRVLRSRRVALGYMLEARVGRFLDLFSRQLANPVMVDAELVLPAFWPDVIPPSFEDLVIPLSVMAADFTARKGVMLGSGPLVSAVAASMAIPGLVRPVRREDLLLIDGGAVNPLPYDPLFEVADVVIACDVSVGRTEDTAAMPGPVQAMLGATQIMQEMLTARILEQRPPDLLLSGGSERFHFLDFFVAPRIIEMAETRKDELKRSIEAVLERRLRGAVAMQAQHQDAV